MHQLGFQIFDGPEGVMLADFGLAEQLAISDGEHGFEALMAHIPMPEDEAFRWYTMPGVPWVVLTGLGGVAWEGRVEDVAVVDGGLEIGAFGGWRAMSDAPYTALWSRTTTAGWRPIVPSEVSTHEPARHQIDNNNRLYMAPRNGETYGNQTNNGGLTYAAPHNGQRNIVAFSASYDITLPTNWQMRLLRCTETFGSITVIQTITGTGVNITGKINQTFTASARLLVEIRNSTGANYTMTSNTGTFYARLTDIRVKTNTAASITANLVAADLVSYINGINSSQLRNITALIQSPGVNLQDELYEDEWPPDILTDLAGRGNGSGSQYEVGVWENRTLHFRPRYSASRTWLVDALDLAISRTMDTFRNQLYAVYRDASNRLQRTAVQTNGNPFAVSVGTALAVAPFTRRGFVNVRTTSQTQAEAERDTRITDTAVITPRANFQVEGLYDEAGSGPYPLWLARAGDLVIIRNLPPGLGTAVDRIRNFRIKRKRYDVIGDVLELTPELEPPDLAVMVAAPGNDSRYDGKRAYGFTAVEG